MPATSVNVNFEPLTDPFIWFATVDAFNAWAGNLTVSITSGNLPAATTDAQGAVMQAGVVNFVDNAVVPTWVVIAMDGGGGVNVPSQQAYTDLKNKVDAMALAFDALLANLKASGQMQDV